MYNNQYMNPNDILKMLKQRLSNMYNEKWNELYHFGIKGMHWGVRRYQNPDGSLTPEGRIHYGKGMPKKSPKITLKNGDYLYKKGTTMGHVGPIFSSKDKGFTGIYLYTNAEDRKYYTEEWSQGEEEHIFISNKDIKMPNNNKLINYCADIAKKSNSEDYFNDDFYDWWKDNINTDGPTHDLLTETLKKDGYDGYQDLRNLGLSSDPIFIFDPEKVFGNTYK